MYLTHIANKEESLQAWCAGTKMDGMTEAMQNRSEQMTITSISRCTLDPPLSTQFQTLSEALCKQAPDSHSTSGCVHVCAQGKMPQAPRNKAMCMYL